jgi:hypothetical protein
MLECHGELEAIFLVIYFASGEQCLFIENANVVFRIIDKTIMVANFLKRGPTEFEYLE